MHPGIYKYDGPRGVLYVVTYRGQNGKQHRRSFDLLREAKAFKAGLGGEKPQPVTHATVEGYMWSWLGRLSGWDERRDECSYQTEIPCRAEHASHIV